MMTHNFSRSTKSSLFSNLLGVLLLLTCCGSAKSQWQAVKDIASSPAALWFYGWVGGKGADWVSDKVTGKPDIEALKQQVDYLITKDLQNASHLRELREALNDKPSRQEVEALMLRTFNKIDKRLAELALKMREQQSQLDQHDRLILGLRNDADWLRFNQDRMRRELGRQSERISRAEEEMVSLREDYPRYKPGEQAELLGVSGMRFLQKEDYREALRSFRYAYAYDEGEPCYLYGMALAYRGLKQNEEAELYVARGIVADRKRSLVYSRVWKNTCERLKWDDRIWLEDLRRDPVYGVRIPGMVRVPSSLSEP